MERRLPLPNRARGRPKVSVSNLLIRVGVQTGELVHSAGWLIESLMLAGHRNSSNGPWPRRSIPSLPTSPPSRSSSSSSAITTSARPISWPSSISQSEIPASSTACCPRSLPMKAARTATCPCSAPVHRKPKPRPAARFPILTVHPAITAAMPAVAAARAPIARRRCAPTSKP